MYNQYPQINDIQLVEINTLDKETLTQINKDSKRTYGG